jgi:hypothetical protein
VTTRSTAPLALVALATVLVAGCGAPSSPSPSAPPPTGTPGTTPVPSATPSSAELVLRVTSEGGFIGPAAGLAAIPAVSVYTDGRIITPATTPAVDPAPLVVPAEMRDVGAAGIAAIETAIRAAGLATASAPGPGVAGDMGATIFTVTLDGSTVRTRFVGLGGGPPGPGGAGGGDPTRAAALDLLTRLMDPAETWGAPAGPATTFRAAGYRVFVAPGAPAGDPASAPPPLDWPLATALDAFGSPAVADRGIAGLRMGVVTGTDATALEPVLARATQLTAFKSGGRSYTLYVRPLLPDEFAG